MATSSIRLATPADKEGVLELLQMMHHESGVFSLDAPLVQMIVEQLLNNPSAGVVGVIFENDKLVATVGLAITQGAWYTRDQTLYELWAFVHPEHRQSTHAKSLLEFAKQCSQRLADKGCPLPWCSMLVSNDSMERKTRLYRRQVPQIGVMFLYRPELASA